MRTTSWTTEQKKIVDGFVLDLAAYCSARINAQTKVIQALDKRPKQVYSDKQPDVFFLYAAQGLMEDLIAELQERV